jgi:hypothetical protein
MRIQIIKYWISIHKLATFSLWSSRMALGHTGIVESVEGDYVHTIEGNTNEDGSREGYEVARRKSLIKSIHGFLRYS